MSAAKLQGMLVRLVNSADRIIQIRRTRLFDVIPENVCHQLVAREVNQPLDAVRERGRVLNVEPAGIQRVAGKQNSCLAIVDGN